jgi:uncharacterized protein (DUF433 family)
MPQITVVTVGDPTTVRTVDRFEDLLPPAIEGGPKFEGTDVSIANLFNFLDKGWNLYIFLNHFPSVSKAQALAALDERVRDDAGEVLHSMEGYVSGTPKFVGTRVMVHILFDYLAHGGNLDEFLCDYPSISREQAVQTLAVAKLALESIAYESAAG